MTWSPVTREEVAYGLGLVERIRDARAAPGIDPGWVPPDVLVEGDGENAGTGLNVLAWIRTATAAGYGFPGWLPSAADFAKSALFERLRSGKPALAEPPPLGLSCPWYALVEDAGPHYVMEAFQDPRDPERLVALCNAYHVVERRGDEDFVVRDAGHETSYRFRLWRDPAYVHPRVQRENDGWFIQSLSFADASPQAARADGTRAPA